MAWSRVAVWVKPIGEGPGVLADQVVHPVPAPGRLGEQVVVGQGLQAAAGSGEAGAAQGGGGIAVDVRAGCSPSRRSSRCWPGTRSSYDKLNAAATDRPGGYPVTTQIARSRL